MPEPGMARPIEALMVLSAVILVAMSGVAAAGACPYTPAVGSTERKAIMDAVRGPVQDYLKLPVVFVAKKFAACRGWAFLEAEPQMPDGKPMNWAATPFATDMAEGMCGGYIHALLVKQNGSWRVRDLVVCATDVPWVTWPKDFGAPPEIFPYIE